MILARREWMHRCENMSAFHAKYSEHYMCRLPDNFTSLDFIGATGTDTTMEPTNTERTWILRNATQAKYRSKIGPTSKEPPWWMYWPRYTRRIDAKDKMLGLLTK